MEATPAPINPAVRYFSFESAFCDDATALPPNLSFICRCVASNFLRKSELSADILTSRSAILAIFLHPFRRQIENPTQILLILFPVLHTALFPAAHGVEQRLV